MICEVVVINSQVRVTLQGAIYVEDAATLRKTLLDYIENGHASVLVDFSAVDYIDSSGLGTMVAIQKRALQHGGGIVVTGLTGLVKDLFELTHLTKVFEMQ